jgi:hypothetical protein
MNKLDSGAITCYRRIAVGSSARLLSILSGLAKKEPSWCNEGSGPH